MQHLTIRGTIALTLTVAACNSAPQVDIEAELASLRAAADEYHRLATAKDADGVAAFYTADAVTLPPCSAPVSGMDGMRSFAEDFTSMPGLQITFTMDHAEVSASGDLGYTYAVASASMDGPDGTTLEEELRDVHLWRKVDGTWKVAFDVWNSPNPLPCPEM